MSVLELLYITLLLQWLYYKSCILAVNKCIDILITINNVEVLFMCITT